MNILIINTEKIMRILLIGDINGNKSWRECGDIDKLLNGRGGERPEFDYYIFLGDYMFSVNGFDQYSLDSFRELMNFKMLYPNKVILLIGDKDLKFLLTEKELKRNGISVPNWRIQKAGANLFYKYRHYFQPVFQIGNNIFSHSLISYSWYATNFLPQLKKEKPYKRTYINIADRINIGWKHRLRSLFQPISEYDMFTRKSKKPSLFYQLYISPGIGIPDIKNYIGHVAAKKRVVYIKDEFTKIILVNTKNESVSCHIINIEK